MTYNHAATTPLARTNASTVPRAGWLVGLFLLGLTARLTILAANPSGLEYWEHETLAQSVASGQGYLITRFGHAAFAFGDGNVYSFLAASVYVLAGHLPLVLAIVQAVLASLAAPVIFAIGERAFGARVAGLGAALAALHPGLLAYTLKLHPLGIDVLLLALSVLWIGRAGDSYRNSLMAGFSLGVSLMSRPTFFLAGLAALFVRQLRSPKRPMLVLVPVAVALLIATPWLLRNWAVLGRPVFISTSLEDVWKGNNPSASGSSYLPNGEDVFSAAPADLRARLEAAGELERSNIFADEIVRFVSQQPGDFIALTARKLAYFWWFSPQEGMFYPTSWLVPYEIYFSAVLAFGLIGAIAILRRGDPNGRALLGMLIAISLTVSIIHALSYVEGRHRWGIEPLLLLLSARGIFAVVSALRSEPGLVRRRALLR
jgi:hypothetical protein